MFKTKTLRRLMARGNVFNKIRAIEGEINSLANRDNTVESLDAISNDLGDQVAGRFIAPSAATEVTEPTSTDFSGAFMSGDGETFGGREYNVGGVENGVLQAGFGSTDGHFRAAAGAFDINSDGLQITGLDFLQEHTATYEGQTRNFRQGFQAQETTDLPPQYVLEYWEGSTDNLITSNPSFEGGDLTGWEQSDTDYWGVIAGGIDGSYMAHENGISMASEKTIVSDRYAITAGNTYLFSGAIGMDGGGSGKSAGIAAAFFTSTASTDQSFYSNFGYINTAQDLNQKSAYFAAPTGATHAAIYFTCLNSTTDVVNIYADNAIIQASSTDYIGLVMKNGTLYSRTSAGETALGGSAGGAVIGGQGQGHIADNVFAFFARFSTTNYENVSTPVPYDCIAQNLWVYVDSPGAQGNYLMVNGVNSTSLYVNTSSTGAAGSTGTHVLSQGDLICLGFDSTGGIRGFSVELVPT